MKVCLLHRANSAVGLYRLWTPGKYLAQEAGWQVKMLPRWLTFDRALQANGDLCHLEDDLAWADLAIYQWIASRHEAQALVDLRAKVAVPSAMDVDDDVFKIPQEHRAYEVFRPKTEEECWERVPIPFEATCTYQLRGWGVGREPDGRLVAIRRKGEDFPALFKQYLQMINALTVSTPFLAETYREHIPARWPIVTLPNCYDPDDWAGITPAEETGHPTIVWAGSVAHDGNIRMIRDALARVFTAVPEAKILVFGAVDLPVWDELPKGHVERVGWCALEEYPRRLASLGAWVGVAPAVDVAFNRAKSHIRWMEYALAGIPCVASPTPEYATWGQDGVRLADSTTTAWTEALIALLRNDPERRRLRARALEIARETCDIRRHIGKWVTAYEALLRAGVTMFQRATPETDDGVPEHERGPADAHVSVPAGV